MASIPSFVRAYLGLLDTAVQAARDLREHAPELPVEVVGNAMQLSLKAQQRFTELAIRGDDVISRLRGAPDEAPAWATFDDDPAPRPDPPAPTAENAVASALKDIADRQTVVATPAKKASAKKVPAKAAKKTPAKKVPAKAAKKTPAKKAVARKAPPLPAKTSPVTAAAASESARPRSAFDLTADPLDPAARD